jgi:hypothetical protein
MKNRKKADRLRTDAGTDDEEAKRLKANRIW